MDETADTRSRHVVGLIPAAGRARRLGRLPLSKEIFPLGWTAPAGAGGGPDDAVPGARVACHHLLERFALAGIERAVMVLRREKLDVPAFLGRDGGRGVALAYVVLDDSASVPQSLAAARPFVGTATVALGFPDVLFEPADAYRRLLDVHGSSHADVTLGLFPTAPERRAATDMVRLADDGRVLDVEVRPAASDLELNWLLAVWGPRFTELLHAAAGTGDTGGADESRLPRLGDLLRRAARELSVIGVPFPEGSFRDLGTPSELVRQLKFSTSAERCP